MPDNYNPVIIIYEMKDTKALAQQKKLIPSRTESSLFKSASGWNPKIPLKFTRLHKQFPNPVDAKLAKHNVNQVSPNPNNEKHSCQD